MEKNETFPNTDCYLICYPAGACGSFISGIFYDFLFGTTSSNFSELGHAHFEAKKIKKNWKIINPEELEVNYVSKDLTKHINPMDINTPLVIKQHILPNTDELFLKYPKCKLVIITVNEQDFPRLQGNAFLKITTSMYEGGDSSRWNKIKDKFPKLLEHIPTPYDLTAREIKILLYEMKNWLHGKYLKSDLKLEKNVYHIPFYDIIHNKNKVLYIISQITNSAITNEIIEGYNKYLTAQEELVRTKMPWVTV